ncbi:hypothetical protein QZH41_008164 [Actinostola sp. cb2023]|nr:hypothetical protein QZH41_008164 [Actinostola sp. cb2023]
MNKGVARTKKEVKRKWQDLSCETRRKESARKREATGTGGGEAPKPLTDVQEKCSFLPRFAIRIETKYLNDNGCTENCFSLDDERLQDREVVHIDIAYDPIPDKYYVPEEDCKHFKSQVTGRGPLEPGWRDTHQPVMCSYKLVKVSFDVWGLSQRVESYVHKVML